METSNPKSRKPWTFERGREIFNFRWEGCPIRGWSESFQGWVALLGGGGGGNFLGGGWYPSACYGAGRSNPVMKKGDSLRWVGDHTFIYRKGCLAWGMGGSP